MDNKENKLYKMALTSCIVMLFLCIIFKLFGFNYFDLKFNNSILNNINIIIMNNFYLSILFSFILKFISGYLIFSIINPNKKQSIFCIACITFFTILIKFNNKNLGIIIDALILLIYPLIFNEFNKTTIKNTIYSLFLNTTYQLISIFLRNIGTIHINTFIISLLMNMDYFILLIITLLYLRRGGVDICLTVHFYSFQAKMLWKKLLKKLNLSLLNNEVSHE